jgi:exodeoxyribonuclease VII small subunit
MARIKPSDSDEAQTFESAMTQLELIVRKLEGNALGLESSLSEYAKAVEYVRFCQQQLEGARRKIEKLRGLTGRSEAIVETWEDDDEN